MPITFWGIHVFFSDWNRSNSTTMAYYQTSGDSAIDWYRSYTTSDAMKYQSYHQAAMQDPYTAKTLDAYHARYATLHQQYQWYNWARGPQNPWMYYYMYQPYGANTMARYSQQPWARLGRNETSPNENYQHQHQLPYRLFHRPSLCSSASHLTQLPPQKEMTASTTLGLSHQNMECMTPRTGSSVFEPRPQNATKIAHGEEVINGENVTKVIMDDKSSNLAQYRERFSFPDDKSSLCYATSEKPWQHFKDDESSCSRQTSPKSAVQENFGEWDYFPKPTISGATKDVMSQIMLEREFLRSGKGHSVVPSVKDSKIAQNLLEEEKAGNLRHQNVNESASPNLSGAIIADKDLEELIFIDQHLDDILNSLDKKNTATVEPSSGLLETDAKRSKGLTGNVSDAFSERQLKRKRRRKRVEHICAVCGQRFTCRATKNTHMRIHSGERPYECPHCNKRFAHRPSLANHIRTHTGEKPYTCRDCGKAFANYSTWQKHCRLHTGEKPYTCTICKKAFTQSSNLKRHRRIHLPAKKLMRRPSLGF